MMRKKKPKPKLPAAATPEQKLAALEYFRQSMPNKKLRRPPKFDASVLDESLERKIAAAGGNYLAPLVTDESFARRAYLDLIGRPPTRDELKAFVGQGENNKRQVLIDELLAKEEFGAHWGTFWQRVIFSKSASAKNRRNEEALEDWFAEQFNEGVGWDQITAQLLAATGKDKDHGPDNFTIACENKPTQMAAETARIFMGIQIQCAECHDHPFDRWKREQFHEMAAFFSRRTYEMPEKYDPEKKREMKPRFLLGEQPMDGLRADHRRIAIAAYLIYNPDNYWFARAFVNRIWNELLGDGFYSVDSLGPDGDVVFKLVVNRLAYVFRYEQFDVKWVFRTIMNSRAYQREIRTIQSPSQMFTAVRPSRLRSNQVAASVRQIIGNDRMNRGIEATFSVDPSVPQADLEGSIQQALLLMNNPVLNQHIRNGPLTKELLSIKANPKMIQQLYLAILARSPTEKETTRGLSFIKYCGNRRQAIEDLVWALLNSAEFLAKR